MSSIVFENVSKRFVLHHNKARSFQDLLIKKLRRTDENGTREDFWALRDVSFEVPEGQTVGLIGANGAGKSTALKLIARIYEPTSGKITTKGRINALLLDGAEDGEWNSFALFASGYLAYCAGESAVAQAQLAVAAR